MDGKESAVNANMQTGFEFDKITKWVYNSIKHYSMMHDDDDDDITSLLNE